MQKQNKNKQTNKKNIVNYITIPGLCMVCITNTI